MYEQLSFSQTFASTGREVRQIVNGMTGDAVCRAVIQGGRDALHGSVPAQFNPEKRCSAGAFYH